MPRPERANRFQLALVWDKTGLVDGQPTLSAYRQIKVRWLKGRHEGLDIQGRTIALDAQVRVGEQIATGSVLWLGGEVDWLGTGSGGTDTELYEVATYREARDIKGRSVSRVLGLKKFRDVLP